MTARAFEKRLRTGDVKSVPQALNYTVLVSQNMFWVVHCGTAWSKVKFIVDLVEQGSIGVIKA